MSLPSGGLWRIWLIPFILCDFAAYSALATNGTSLECLNLIVQSINSAAAHAQQQQHEQQQQQHPSSAGHQYHPHHQQLAAQNAPAATAQQMTSGGVSAATPKAETKVL